MRSEVIFIMQRAFSRLKSYNLGIIKLRSKIGEQDTGDLIGNTTPQAFYSQYNRESKTTVTQ
jgi:hypothetical protein